jgi:hypothetical protein
MLTQTTIHRQEDHHYRISTMVSQSLLVLNGLDRQDRMQNPNHRVPSGQCKLGSKYLLLNLFRKAGDTPNAGHSTYNALSTPSIPSASPSPALGTIHLPSST